MCGLAGFLNTDGMPASRRIAESMSVAIAHRGPDGHGVDSDGPFAVGHRRLSIIDLTENASQPMRSQDDRYILAYNGEIYNFRELRRELEALGHGFRSTSDTEVLLEAWRAWGPDCLNRFNGMFAFAIWDAKERTLSLARDRYGIKPLYIATQANRLVFGSEIKALLQHPDVQADTDPDGLAEYMTFQNFFGTRTLFRGIELLPPATLRTYSADGQQPQETRFWDWCFQEPADNERATEAEYVEELDRLFTQAVERQLVSDVDVGSYLSGGIDSGAVTAIAARNMPGMRTFTIGFDLHSASGLELAYDEREGAEYMSYLFGTEHYEMVLKAGDMERAMPAMATHLEEPRVGQSYPNYYAARLASRFGKVVLSGTGGDEIFAGYPWRYYRAVVNDDFAHYTEKYYRYWQRLMPDQDRVALLSPLGVNTDMRNVFASVFSSHAAELTRPEDYINHSLYFEARTFLHGLLVVEDKLSMSQGLETRVPFLDNDLVDFASRVPNSLKLGNLNQVVRLNENEPGDKTRRYFEKTHDGKLVLRKALEKYVPPRVTRAVKQGFSAPDASWFRGESIELVRRKLLNPDARIYSVFDKPTVQKLVNDHLEGRENRRLLIWSFLQVEGWLETFMADASATKDTASAAEGA
jgi:asparagine synthase (glutamine-hydrolysing)